MRLQLEQKRTRKGKTVRRKEVEGKKLSKVLKEWWPGGVIEWWNKGRSK